MEESVLGVPIGRMATSWVERIGWVIPGEWSLDGQVRGACSGRSVVLVISWDFHYGFGWKVGVERWLAQDGNSEFQSWVVPVKGEFF